MILFMILRIKIALAYIKYFYIIRCYKHAANRKVIDEDMERWCKEMNIIKKGSTSKLVFLLIFAPQFRNLLYFRLKPRINFFLKLCPQDPTISIAEDHNDIMGGGIYFEHAFSTIIAAKRIGYGCLFRQLTTIGVKSKNRHDEKPTIGNNVDFGANVTCIGNITIGDNAIIADGSVVVKDVPANAVVAGNPAHVVKYIVPINN